MMLCYTVLIHAEGANGGLYYCRGLNSSIIVPTMAGKRRRHPAGHPVIHRLIKGDQVLFVITGLLMIFMTWQIIVILHIILPVILTTVMVMRMISFQVGFNKSQETLKVKPYRFENTRITTNHTILYRFISI